MFEKAVLIGCGLIGGSLALALKQSHCVKHLTAVELNPQSCQLALSRAVVDHVADSLQDAVQDADLIVLATPVREMAATLEVLAELPLRPGCLITDVGSTKREICAEARRLLPASVVFIGGHPMAGSERSGVEAATSRLFQGSVYVLTPFADSDPDVFAKWKWAVERIGAQVMVLDPNLHDEVVAAISHVPHIIAAQLVEQVAKLSLESESGALYARLAAGGFRDVTRIASGNPLIWRDIVLSNRDVIRDLLQGWQQSIHHFLGMLEQEAGPEIENFFSKAAEFRDGMK
ncbi:prephenate dehydrogenase [Tumebacillus algifaecis]|nr:prephenate dehydrogenase [Tumebacillus algifaecis]